MKKCILGIALAVVALFSGCTTVESTQKFNGLGLGDKEEKAVCKRGCFRTCLRADRRERRVGGKRRIG